MASKLEKTSSLSLSRKPLDFDNLPLRLNESRSGQGIVLMLFASVWGGIPGAVLATQWGELEDDAYFVLLFPLIGAALFLYGAYSLFSRSRLLIDRNGVSCDMRSLFRRERWHAPLNGYRGVLLKTVVIRRGKSSIRADAVYLEHRRDNDRSVPLFVSTDAAAARRQWEAAAKFFDLDALEVTVDGEVARAPRDLDKSVRELAAEGKLDVDFEARPPPPSLRARYDGSALVVTTAEPTLPKKLTLPALLGLVAVAFIFPLVGPLIAVGAGGWLLWDRFVGQELRIEAGAVVHKWLLPWRTVREARIAADRIEAVRVEAAAGGRRAHLAVVSDERTLRFAGGRPREALQWARQAVLAHVAA